MHAESAERLAGRILRPFGIPAITPFALAVFRVLFGLGLLYILLDYQPIVAKTVDVRRPHSPLADAEWVYALAMSHGATLTLEILACAGALCFIAGVFARIAYVVVVGAMLLNVLVILTSTGSHDWGLPIVTYILLAIVPWGDTPPLTELRRSWRKYATPDLASRVYGFAVWLPGLTVGLAFAAAAYAKVVGTGIRWITNGTVRYHFVEDGRNAPITLGLWIAAHEPVAILVSFAAVFIEAVFILVVFARDWRTRLAFGLMGASLMAGFTLLQDVAWWPWRILFLAFLPWSQLTVSAHTPDVVAASTARPRNLTWVHAGLVAVLVVSQAWASWKVIEVEPFISNFPMYAYTWSSTEEFDRRHARTRFWADGVDISDKVENAEGEDALSSMVSGKALSDDDREEVSEDLARFRANYQRMYGHLPADVDVMLVQRPFDWKEGKYLPETREPIGTVHLNP